MVDDVMSLVLLEVQPPPVVLHFLEVHSSPWGA